MDIKELTEKVEKVSVHYAQRFRIERDSEWLVLKLQEEIGEMTQAYLMLRGKGRAKGKTKEQMKEEFESELMDVLCHVLLLVKHYDVDIDTVLEKKWFTWLADID